MDGALCRNNERRTANCFEKSSCTKVHNEIQCNSSHVCQVQWIKVMKLIIFKSFSVISRTRQREKSSFLAPLHQRATTVSRTTATVDNKLYYVKPYTRPYMLLMFYFPLHMSFTVLCFIVRFVYVVLRCVILQLVVTDHKKV